MLNIAQQRYCPFDWHIKTSINNERLEDKYHASNWLDALVEVWADVSKAAIGIHGTIQKRA